MVKFSLRGPELRGSALNHFHPEESSQGAPWLPLATSHPSQFLMWGGHRRRKGASQPSVSWILSHHCTMTALCLLALITLLSPKHRQRTQNIKVRSKFCQLNLIILSNIEANL